jgi:hypothetical protein
MTNEQINIAIFEIFGWKWEPEKNSFFHPENGRLKPKYALDYCNDLNAMHEAEKTLTKEQVRVYSDFLAHSPHESCWASCTIWHQTSRQRAEAFLKTLGKWEE